MKKKYVLFDFDGVIADTERSNEEFLRNALAQYGIELTVEDRKSMLGTNNKSIIDSLLAKSPIPVSRAEFQETRDRMGNTYENTDILPMPGLRNMLEYLKNNKIKMAIASSTSSRLILSALDRMDLTKYFDVIVCGDMCSESKPHPQIYLKTMKYLGANCEECIVIEDSSAGIKAGKNAGAYVIAYTGSSIEQDISEAKCSVSSYCQCQKLLNTLLCL